MAENALVASLLRFLFSGPAGAAHIGEPPSQQIWFDLFLIFVFGTRPVVELRTGRKKRDFTLLKLASPKLLSSVAG